MPEGVHGHVLGGERRAGVRGFGDVVGDAMFDGVAAEGPAGDGREQRVAGRATLSASQVASTSSVSLSSGVAR